LSTQKIKKVAELFHFDLPIHKKPEIPPQRKKMPPLKVSKFPFMGTFSEFCPVFPDFETWHGVCSTYRAVKRPMDWVTTNKSL
jgi:hypothetical protein